MENNKLSTGFLEVLKIDKFKKKYVVRILFCIVLALNFGVAYVGDADFSSFFNFMEKVVKDPMNYVGLTRQDIPLTSENIIFLLYSIFACYISFSSSFIYCSLFVRDFRINNRKFNFNRMLITTKIVESEDTDILKSVINKMEIREYEVLSRKKLILRNFVMMLTILLVIILVPLVAVLFPLIALILSVFDVIILFLIPIVLVIIANYVSGDSGFFISFKKGFKALRGNYISYMFSVSTLILTFWMIRLFINMLGNNVPFSYALWTFALSYFWLALGRLMGIKHCLLNDSSSEIVKLINKKLM